MEIETQDNPADSDEASDIESSEWETSGSSAVTETSVSASSESLENLDDN